MFEKKMFCLLNSNMNFQNEKLHLSSKIKITQPIRINKPIFEYSTLRFV